MKMRLIGSLCFIIIFFTFANSELCADIIDDQHKKYSEIVYIGPTGISMPLNRIILIRQGSTCCALKFTEMWVPETKDDMYKGKNIEAYSRYTAYYQGNGTDDFLASNVQTRENELIQPKLRGFHPFYYRPGVKTEIECGTIRILWGSKGSVHYFRGRDMDNPKAIIEYGIALAPTPWKDIKDVKINDPRIKWYKYGASQNKDIPIDKLWE